MLIQSVAKLRASFRVCNSHSDLARCPSRDGGNDHEPCLSDMHPSQVRLPMRRLAEYAQSRALQPCPGLWDRALCIALYHQGRRHLGDWRPCLTPGGNTKSFCHNLRSTHWVPDP